MKRLSTNDSRKQLAFREMFVLICMFSLFFSLALTSFFSPPFAKLSYQKEENTTSPKFFSTIKGRGKKTVSGRYLTSGINP